MYAGFLAVAGLAIPSVAAVNGPVIGAGVNLPLAVRRDPVLTAGAVRPEVHGPRHPPRRRSPVAHATAGRTPGRGGDGDLRRSPLGRGSGTVGLAWRCVDDDALLDTAVGLARRAADRPRELIARAKAVLDESAAIHTAAEAFELEFAHQDWSMQQPAFQDRLAQLAGEARQADVSRSVRS